MRVEVMEVIKDSGERERKYHDFDFFKYCSIYMKQGKREFTVSYFFIIKDTLNTVIKQTIVYFVDA